MAVNLGERLLTPREVAVFLSVKPDRVYDLVSSRRLRARRIGRQLRFTQKDIDDFLERNATD